MVLEFIVHSENNGIIFVFEYDVTAYGLYVIFLRFAVHAFICIQINPVISIAVNDELTGCDPHTVFSGSALACVFLMFKYYSAFGSFGILFHEPFQYIDTIVRRAIVDKNVLYAVQSLLVKRSYATFYIWFGIIYRYDNGYLIHL
jgi:hypothetical protein